MNENVNLSGTQYYQNAVCSLGMGYFSSTGNPGPVTQPTPVSDPDMSHHH